MKKYTHSTYSYVTIVEVPFSEIEKIDFALCNQPTETPDAYYKRQGLKPDIITNGGFFAMNNGNTVFGFTDEGQTISTENYYGVGITGTKTLSYSKQDSKFRDFISAYPPLVINGKKANITYANELNYKARRTCIGWNSSTYFVVTVDKPGLAYAALQNIFMNLGATFAINLDGGGSTRMLIEGKRVTSESYARPVDNVMCVYLKKSTQPVEKVYYRVQTGAFLQKANAEKLLADLISKGFTDAYIKKIGVYYKVQLGAFTVKLNAERLLDKVEAFGYSAFITTK